MFITWEREDFHTEYVFNSKISEPPMWGMLDNIYYCYE